VAGNGQTYFAVAHHDMTRFTNDSKSCIGLPRSTGTHLQRRVSTYTQHRVLRRTKRG
jgi:hypothetical protein